MNAALAILRRGLAALGSADSSADAHHGMEYQPSPLGPVCAERCAHEGCPHVGAELSMWQLMDSRSFAVSPTRAQSCLTVT